MKIPCEFVNLRNGRLYCYKHEQSLMYIFNKTIICQVGEDELIGKLGLTKYIVGMKNREEKDE